MPCRSNMCPPLPDCLPVSLLQQPVPTPPPAFPRSFYTPDNGFKLGHHRLGGKMTAYVRGDGVGRGGGCGGRCRYALLGPLPHITLRSGRCGSGLGPLAASLCPSIRLSASWCRRTTSTCPSTRILLGRKAASTCLTTIQSLCHGAGK